MVIHTANMLSGDWTNMTQAVWRSPLLPLQRPDSPSSNAQAGIGSSLRFKRDLLAYLNVYGTKKTGSLVQQLQRYDFGAVRAALIASVPSKQQTSNLDSDKSTVWGWPALKDLMSRVPVQRQHQTSASGGNGHIVIQVLFLVLHVSCLLLTTPGLLSSHTRPNRQMAERRLLHSPISDTTRSPSEILHHIPDTR